MSSDSENNQKSNKNEEGESIVEYKSISDFDSSNLPTLIKIENLAWTFSKPGFKLLKTIHDIPEDKIVKMLLRAARYRVYTDTLNNYSEYLDIFYQPVYIQFLESFCPNFHFSFEDIQADNLLNGILNDNMEDIIYYHASTTLSCIVQYEDSPEYNLSFLNFAALSNSLKAYKYFRTNNYAVNDGVDDFDESYDAIYSGTINCAICGGNEEIIEMLANENKSFNNKLFVAIYYHRNSIAKWIYENYETRLCDLSDFKHFYNSEMLLYFCENGAINKEWMKEQLSLFRIFRSDLQMVVVFAQYFPYIFCLSKYSKFLEHIIRSGNYEIMRALINSKNDNPKRLAVCMKRFQKDATPRIAKLINGFYQIHKND